MTPGLFVLSGDTDFVNELRSRLSARLRFLVAESLEDARTQRHSVPLQAALAHVSPKTLNGYSPEFLLNALKQLVGTVPIYAVADPSCATHAESSAGRTAREWLPVPVDYAHLDRLLASHSPAVELGGYHADLPHRVLEGQTRSLVTFTPSMFEMFDELKVAAAHDVTMLLIGETGSGKSYLARVIHELSNRANQRCLTVACGALPPDLIESELFGYVKGAFTGADADKLGKFAAADQGTLLLDEIDVLTPDQQAKLLRVIETGEYEPVGSNDTQTSTARLIAASNIDLEELVKSGKFRMDLYYRLNTLSFHLPPLRDRPWDIDFLAGRFALSHSRVHDIQLGRIEPEFLSALRRYRWPGNIRELENVIRRAVLYCRDGVLGLPHLPSSMRPAPSRTSAESKGNGTGKPNSKTGGNAGGSGSGDGRTALTLEERIGQIEHRIIEETLERHGRSRTDTARELGISRVTLYNKMKKFGILN